MALSLDALTQDPSHLDRTEGIAPLADAPALPPENRLAMPVQSLRQFSASEVRKPVNPYRPPYFARLFVFGAGLALTGWGAYEMYRVVSVSSVTILQWALLALFTLNFSWIAVAFTSAIVGFAAELRRKPAPPLPARLKAKTAVLSPVYNEATARVFASLYAMIEDIEA